MRRALSVGLSILIGSSCAYVTAVIGLRLWLAWRNPSVNFSVVPTKISEPYARNKTPVDWPVNRFDLLTFSIPSSWKNLRSSNTSIVWGNEAISFSLFRPRLVKTARYRRWLYETWHPLALFDRAILFPGIDPHRVKIVEQRIGPWQSFVFSTPEKWWCTLFQHDTEVTAIFHITGPDNNTEKLVKDIVANIDLNQK